MVSFEDGLCLRVNCGLWGCKWFDFIVMIRWVRKGMDVYLFYFVALEFIKDLVAVQLNLVYDEFIGTTLEELQY